MDINNFLALLLVVVVVSAYTGYYGYLYFYPSIPEYIPFLADYTESPDVTIHFNKDTYDCCEVASGTVTGPKNAPFGVYRKSTGGWESVYKGSIGGDGIYSDAVEMCESGNFKFVAILFDSEGKEIKWSNIVDVRVRYCPSSPTSSTVATVTTSTTPTTTSPSATSSSTTTISSTTTSTTVLSCDTWADSFGYPYGLPLVDTGWNCHGYCISDCQGMGYSNCGGSVDNGVCCAYQCYGTPTTTSTTLADPCMAFAQGYDCPYWIDLASTGWDCHGYATQWCYDNVGTYPYFSTDNGFCCAWKCQNPQ